jgi:hypothetical protein
VAGVPRGEVTPAILFAVGSNGPRLTAIVAVQVVATAAALAVHRAAFAPKPAAPDATPTEDVRAEIAGIRRDLAAARARAGESAPGAGPALDALARDAVALDRRLQRLEDLRARETALPAGVPSTVPAHADGRPYTDEEVHAFEALLAEAERARVRERARENAVRSFAAAGAILSAEDARRAGDAVLAYQAELERLFPGGSGGRTLEERQATARKAGEARAALEATLRALLPTSVFDRAMASYPAIPVPSTESGTPGR